MSEFTEAERVYYNGIIAMAGPATPVFLGYREYMRLMEYAKIKFNNQPITTDPIMEPL